MLAVGKACNFEYEDVDALVGIFLLVCRVLLVLLLLCQFSCLVSFDVSLVSFGNLSVYSSLDGGGIFDSSCERLVSALGPKT